MARFLPVFLTLALLWASVVSAEDKWVADEIFLQLSQMRQEIQHLQKKVATLEQALAEQKAFAEPISLAGTEYASLGKRNAKIAIVEFSDYECPFCAKHYSKVLPMLRERYIDQGTVKYVLKDYPLEFHAYAKQAALAARCAGEQGQYWAMHNIIFDARGQADEALLAKATTQLNLNAKAFKQCLVKPSQLAAVKDDMALGNRLGVNGTPAFVIGIIKNQQLVNYQRLDGLQTIEGFARVIDSLKKH